MEVVLRWAEKHIPKVIKRNLRAHVLDNASGRPKEKGNSVLHDYGQHAVQMKVGIVAVGYLSTHCTLLFVGAI